MKVVQTDIPDVLLIEPQVFGDERGFFYESYNERAFLDKVGVSSHFVQDNHSRSSQKCSAWFALPDSSATRKTCKSSSRFSI